MELSWPRVAPPALLTSTTTTTLVCCTRSTPTASPACVCLSTPSCLRLRQPATGPVRSRSGTKDCEWKKKREENAHTHPSSRLYFSIISWQKELGKKCWKSANLLFTDAFEKQFFLHCVSCDALKTTHIFIPIHVNSHWHENNSLYCVNLTVSMFFIFGSSENQAEIHCVRLKKVSLSSKSELLL